MTLEYELMYEARWRVGNQRLVLCTSILRCLQAGCLGKLSELYANEKQPPGMRDISQV